MNPRAWKLLVILAMAGYPFAVYMLAGNLPASILGAIFCALVALRIAVAGTRGGARRPVAWLLMTLALVAAFLLLVFPVLNLSDVRLYPVFISACVASVFLGSLLTGRPLVERIARAMEGDLPQAAIVYTRRVTIVWGLVLATNAVISLATALWGSMAIWTFYNGLLSYLIMGLVFGIELLVRRRMRRRWG